jgi:hypothetical protein
VIGDADGWICYGWDAGEGEWGDVSRLRSVLLTRMFGSLCCLWAFTYVGQYMWEGKRTRMLGSEGRSIR